MKVRNETTNRAVLGAILLCLRGLKQLTQDQIASAAGVSAPTWSRIEKGENPLTVEQLRRVSLALGVQASSILKLEEDVVAELGSSGILVGNQLADIDSESKCKLKEDVAEFRRPAHSFCKNASVNSDGERNAQFVVPVVGQTLVIFITYSTSLMSWNEAHGA